MPGGQVRVRLDRHRQSDAGGIAHAAGALRSPPARGRGRAEGRPAAQGRRLWRPAVRRRPHRASRRRARSPMARPRCSSATATSSASATSPRAPTARSATSSRPRPPCSCTASIMCSTPSSTSSSTAICRWSRRSRRRCWRWSIATIDSFLGREEINRIFTLRRELIRFQRVLGPMGEVASKLARQDLPCIDAETRPYFSDVLDHVRRVQAMVDGLREVLTSVFEFEQPARAAADRRDHPPARRLGRDPRRADRDRRHLRHEFRAHARARHALRLFRRARGHRSSICTWLYVRFKRARWL